MKKTALPTTAFVLALVLFAATASLAAEHFVSVSGDWVPAGHTGTCYTDLRTALNAAQSGDTVWLQDGYLYDSGNTGNVTGTNGGYARARIHNKAVILRSESGYVDEAAGKGATIRGAWHDPENGTVLGVNAVHCLWVSGNAATASEIFGLVFEGGSGGNSHTGGFGGGFFSDVGCIVSNCVFRNNSAHSGGAIGNGRFTVYNCVMTNNWAGNGAYGGGAVWGPSSCYDSLIASNKSVKMGGAIAWNWQTGVEPPVYSNCTIVGNSTGPDSGGGGAAYFAKERAATFIDCRIADNVVFGNAGGVYGPATLIRCDIVGNVCSNVNQNQAVGGGVHGGTFGPPFLTGASSPTTFPLAPAAGLPPAPSPTPLSPSTSSAATAAAPLPRPSTTARSSATPCRISFQPPLTMAGAAAWPVQPPPDA